MKCKSCNGTGKIQAINFSKPDWKDTETVCSICFGTGIIEQTEEEWLKSRNTKELAQWIDNLLKRCLCGDCNFCPINKQPHCTCEAIEEWLKQPHTSERR